MMKKSEVDRAQMDPAKAQQELSKHPGHLIRRLNQISVSIFLREASKYDLTQLQYAALVVVDANPGIDQGRLGRIAALDRQTVSTVVKRLTEKGLVRQEAKDRRSKALYVTGSGKALYHVMDGRLDGVDKTLLGAITPKEQKIFMETLKKMVENLNDLSRAPQSDAE